MKILLSMLLVVSVVTMGIGQTKHKLDPKFEKQYKRNIRKAYIKDVYIPKTVEEACMELERLADADAIAKFKQGDEEVVIKKLHFGLGRWIMINWNLEYGSRYGQLLKDKGVKHMDDMIDFTIGSFHRYLNGKELDIDNRANELRERRKKEYDERMASRKLIKKETKIVKKEE